MKKLISLIVVFVLIITLCCFGAGAAEESSGSENDFEKLYYFWYAYQNEKEMSGGVNVYYYAQSASLVEDEVKAVFKAPTDESAHRAFEDLKSLVFEQKYIDYDYAKATYNNALLETNSDGWYTDAEWSDFQSKLAGLKTALDSFVSRGEDLVDDKALTDAFHALLKAYNTMTNRDALAGDVNGDGCVNIRDVTMVQRYLAEFEPLNGAQKMRAALSGMKRCDSISVSDATQLQKHIAEYDDSGIAVDGYGSNVYTVFVDEAEVNPLESKEFMTERLFNFAICPVYADALDPNCSMLSPEYRSTINFIHQLMTCCDMSVFE